MDIMNYTLQKGTFLSWMFIYYVKNSHDPNINSRYIADQKILQAHWLKVMCRKLLSIFGIQDINSGDAAD